MNSITSYSLAHDDIVKQFREMEAEIAALKEEKAANAKYAAALVQVNENLSQSISTQFAKIKRQGDELRKRFFDNKNLEREKCRIFEIMKCQNDKLKKENEELREELYTRTKIYENVVAKQNNTIKLKRRDIEELTENNTRLEIESASLALIIQEQSIKAKEEKSVLKHLLQETAFDDECIKRIKSNFKNGSVDINETIMELDAVEAAAALMLRKCDTIQEILNEDLYGDYAYETTHL